jgi:hypothetical protein
MVSAPVDVSVQWESVAFRGSTPKGPTPIFGCGRSYLVAGHFTAKQTPELVAADMREFFRGLRDYQPGEPPFS